MSPEVAGLTILALGNGAPDVSTTIIAIHNDSFGTSIGELLGAGMFVTTVVVALVSFFSEANLDKANFIRDVLFYVVGLLVVAGITADKQVYVFESILFLVYYAAYVATASWYHYCGHRCIKSKLPPSMKLEINDVEGVPLKGSNDLEENSDGPFTFSRFRKDWSRRSPFNKVSFIVTFPFSVWLKITVPETERWNRPSVILSLIFSPQLILLASGQYSYKIPMGSIHFPLSALLLLIGIVLAVIVFFVSRDEIVPPWNFIVIFWSFAMSIVWIYLISNELVAELEDLGIILNVSNVILGATVLAWGNSVPDMMSDVLMARRGLPQMAIAACYGGPLFNMLLGLGIALTIKTSITFPKTFVITDLNGNWPEFYLSVFTLAISLFLSLMAISFFRFRIPRKWGIVLIAIYVIYTILLLLTEFNVIFGKK
eukprot:TRINITY_DN5549_c0_g1_i2.p1 TRINITY_DN5549_c0_g1~~TRINITY_DN5549_c0_g1_i2.p1  ORF type:complete len:495 (-),score=46.60 TRINITY_DN5549_c0_g1_i2:4-1287(-)